MSSRNRACAAVLDSTGKKILMVKHKHDGKEYWTLPGGGQEDRETLAETAAREFLEETGLRIDVLHPLFDETYDHQGTASLSRCFFGKLTGRENAVLGHDPEQSGIDKSNRMLQDVAWWELSDLAEDVQVSKVVSYLSAEAQVNSVEAKVAQDQSGKFFRVHTQDVAYATQLPRGLFVAIGRLVDGKVVTEAEIKDYWENRKWFEEHLPVPPFYSDGNSIKAITWYKTNENGKDMFERMGFYRRMAEKYGIRLFQTTAMEIPGRVIYEDEYQIGVVDSRHSGTGFVEEEIT